MKSKVNWLKIISVMLFCLTLVVVILLYIAMKDRWKDDVPVYKVTQEDIAFHDEQGRYYYSHLTDEEKKVYIEVLGVVKNYMSDVAVSVKDSEVLQKICIYVECDYPDIFYTDGFSYKNSYRGGTKEFTTLLPKYTMEKSEIEEKQVIIEREADKCLQGIPAGADDYEKVKYVYEYIINNTRYVENCADNQNICSVFLNGESVCQGYAKATQYLLNKLGIKTTIVSGHSVSDKQPHAWNLAKIGDNYYYLDTTWGDGLNPDTSQEGMAVSYDFLNYTTEDLEKYMKPDEIVVLPVCDSIDYNYYVVSGNYFTSVDEKQLKEVFDSASDEDMDNVSLKCDNENVYNKMLTYLFTEEKIFDYLKNKTKITYTKNDEMRTISFSL